MEKVYWMWFALAVGGVIVGCIDMYVLPIRSVSAGWFFLPLISGFLYGWFMSIIHGPPHDLESDE